MNRLEKIRHAKLIIDTHFEGLLNDEEVTDDEVIEGAIEISGAAFSMAESFGYNKLIAKIIDNE